MTDLAKRAADRLPWISWLGASVMIGWALYWLATGDRSKSRYPIVLILGVLSGVAQAEAKRTGSVRLGRLADGLMGAGGGLVVAGFLD